MKNQEGDVMGKRRLKEGRDLSGELACREEDEDAADNGAAAAVHEALEDGQDKRGCFAAAGAGGSADVAALHGDWDDHALDLRGVVVARGGDGAQQGAREVERGEGFAAGRKSE